MNRDYEIIDGKLIVYSNNAVKAYCSDNGLDKDAFDMQVIIDSSVKDCSKLLSGCATFNQPIAIPDGVENCDAMFQYCTSFNHKVDFPNSVKSCSYVFESCRSFNQEVIIPNSVKNCMGMFFGCSRLNSKVILSKSAKDYRCVFTCCESFNKPLIIPRSDCTPFEDLRSKQTTYSKYIEGLPHRPEYPMHDMLSYCDKFNNVIVVFEDRLQLSDFVTRTNGMFEETYNVRFNVTHLGTIRILITDESDKCYDKLISGSLFSAMEDIMKYYPEYSKYYSDILNTFINISISRSDTESYTALLDLKDKMGLYQDDSLDGIRKQFNLDDDDSSNGETHLF